ncbi:MAG: phosphatase PAP2 family protein [Microbacteriaceae bacterium]
MHRSRSRHPMPSRARHPYLALRRAAILPAWVRHTDIRFARAFHRHADLPGVDRGFVQLSHSANRSRLWMVIAVILVVAGRANRRGAIRGVLSVLVASIIANLIGKKVFGGDRPLLKDVPIGRQLKKSPTSPSFPSGHSASAAAFATGVALESPAAGVAIAPLAAAVVYSRLHTGAHWLSDVIGGSLIGISVALLSKKLLPLEQTALHPHAPLVDLPALPDGDGLLLLVNPTSGQRMTAHDPSEDLAAKLPKALIRPLEEGDDIAAIVREAAESATGPRVLGIHGGDGSVAAAAHAARSANLPLLVLPGGSFNHFARTAGIPTVDTGLDALRAGTGRRVHVAELSLDDGPPITVLNEASAGVYPAFVAEREKREHQLGKLIAGSIAAVTVLAKARPEPVTVNGRNVRLWSLFVGVGRNAPSRLLPLQRKRLHDATLDVRILHVRGRASRFRGMVALAFGARVSALLERLPLWAGETTVEAFTTDAVQATVRPWPGQPTGLAHDGEVTDLEPEGQGGAEHHSVMRIVPDALDVYSPAHRGE